MSSIILIDTPLYRVKACVVNLQLLLDNWEQLADHVAWSELDETKQLVYLNHAQPTSVPELVVDVRGGLCYNVFNGCLAHNDKYRLFASWSEYSGCKMFPITNELGEDPEYVWEQDLCNPSMFSNPARKRLAEHCLAVLKGHLEKVYD